MKGRTLVLSIALLAGTVFPAQAMAQSDSNQKVEELQKQLDELRKQMSKLEAQLGELRSKATEAAAPTAAPPAAQEGTIQATLPPAQAAPSKQVGEATATYTTFSEDSVAAARFNNVPLDHKYHGFFRLPGTETLLKIGGYFKTDFIYDLKPAGNTDAFVPSSIPIPTVVGVNNTTVSIRPTRLSLDFRVPTTNIGDVRFYVEGDLFGTNATTPRLRHAYAQARNVLIGQTFSNFMDPDGFPDTLDFQGPNGMVSVRNPQLRYGLALTPSTTLYISVEKPSSDVIFALAFGHGISRYLQDTSGLGIDAEPKSSTGLKATPAVGVEAAYQHYWLKTLRSSAIYSYAAVNNTAFLASAAPATYNHATYMGSNLIWNPYGSLNVGVEFLYGWAMEQSGLKANAPRIQFSAKYSFVKVDADR